MNALPASTPTPEQVEAIEKIASQHARVTYRPFDALGRLIVETDCDETGSPTSSFVVELDGSVRGA